MEGVAESAPALRASRRARARSSSLCHVLFLASVWVLGFLQGIAINSLFLVCRDPWLSDSSGSEPTGGMCEKLWVETELWHGAGPGQQRRGHTAPPSLITAGLWKFSARAGSFWGSPQCRPHCCRCRDPVPGRLPSGTNRSRRKQQGK